MQKSMNHTAGKPINLLFRVLNRGVVFFLLYTCVFFVLYLTGNTRNFLDSTLLFLLESISVLSGVLFVCSIGMLCASVVFAVCEKNPLYLARISLPLFSSAFSAVLFVFSRSVYMLCTPAVP
ncbi:MAG: hypothetical protein NC041_04540 [Bacteroides sp.]|nr:hypothetical protein [Prevotella sp.]MCM1407227.1 hypothetical protein [Treponema brennaborense]MCM1469715.1 hypothetical protein [Bacteroides sp.]